MTITLDRHEVIAHRIAAQQLDREPDSQDPAAPSVLDLGVQETGGDAASWALANRGARIASPAALHTSDDLAVAWTLRGAPHVYRRADLPDVQVAVSPWSDADAAKRIFDANKPLKDAGIGALSALTEVATQMRSLVVKPMVKGEMSTGLTDLLPAEYVRFCVPCQATHPYEQPFRLSALHAGLELEPGTSPPILRRVPGWPRRRPGPAADPGAAPPHLQPIRACLSLLGPTTPRDVAGFLDMPLAVVKAHWPDDATEVTVEGRPAWTLDPLLPRTTSDIVRLLGPFDLLLQARDRDLLVPDPGQHKILWPTLGRPGAILVSTDVIGTWRPKATGKKLSVRLELWDEQAKTVRGRIEEQAERLAGHRGLSFAGFI